MFGGYDFGNNIDSSSTEAAYLRWLNYPKFTGRTILWFLMQAISTQFHLCNIVA
ncbi:hypothetical protein ADIS_2721 [Lunatimonas lonarensis]|uniref:Uncharacterized protein n=1 Tax=Lunatimonas lonarensis TaxID=1232681 RepID=R7ZRV8_9BACT|nr:hypothetical protein ADIS_2721 [Lunatimonas lonarensis]